MSLRDLNNRHLWLISRYWTRYAVRGGAALAYLLLTLMFGLGTTIALFAGLDAVLAAEKKKSNEVSKAEIVAGLVEGVRPAIQWILGVESEKAEARGQNHPAAASQLPAGAGPSSGVTGFGEDRVPQPAPGEDAPTVAAAAPGADPWTEYLLSARPAVLSALFLIMVFGLPLLIPVLAFNQVSGDVQSRGLRYVLLRTERANIFFGRFLGTAAFAIFTNACVVAIIAAYIGFKLRIYPAGDMLGWALYGFVALSVLALPYIAVCSWLSASIDSPFLSLVVTGLVIGGVPLVSFLGRMKWQQAKFLNYAMPWPIQNYLFHPDWPLVLGAAAACLAYTAFFLGVGYWHFSRRDL